jgi:alpha-glucosidase
MKKITFLALLVITGYGCSSEKQVKLSSPDENVSIEVKTKSNDSVNSGSSGLFYSVSFHGEEIITDSPLGLEFKGMAPFGHECKITGKEFSKVDKTWERPWGKRKTVKDTYSQVSLSFKEKGTSERTFGLEIRAYNDGVAFRYIIPSQDGLSSFKLTHDNTGFRFKDNPTAWAATYGGFVSHQEAEFKKMKISEMDSVVFGLPVLVKTANETYAAITEANLTDWAGMYVSLKPGSSDELAATLSPRRDETDVLVKSEAPRHSPWRVIMLSKKAGEFLASDLIENLNDPCALKDVSWIKSGKSAWDWWWCNSYLPNAKFLPGSNNATMKYFIDFASEMGWQYQLVDWYWYGPPFTKTGNYVSNPESDITVSNQDINIPELVKYAKSKNVKLFLWLEWSHVDKQMDVAFPLYEKWGIAGIKVDFMQRDDQEMVNFYHRCVKKAAEHHLMVDFHGAYKPTGDTRTYPNMLTREGVMGNEYTKWSSRITPEHTVTLPFTRGMLGGMDFTPGAWVNVKPKDFKTEAVNLTPLNSKTARATTSPMVMGTRCNQLAMMVVYESALQVLCDSPDNYRKSPKGLNFLSIVPTTWDDTRVLNAEVGNYITVARRSGDEWFIGSMTDSKSRTIDISLEFLPAGKYTAHIWKDNTNPEASPAELDEVTMEVTSGSIIKAELASGGGHVMHIKPV